MTRRANNEGSIWRRRDGRWCGAYFVPRPGGEGRVRKYVYGHTRAEVHAKLTQVIRQVQQGVPVPVHRLSVGEYLDEWLQQVAAVRVRPRTLAGYEQNVRLHLVPRLGRRRLGALSPRDVRQLLDALRGEGLSSRTVQHVHATLRAALEHAVREELLSRNVAKLVRVPTPRRAEREALTLDEVRLLLKAGREDRLFALYVVALLMGLRRSELVGLRWEDVDLEKGVLRVRRTLQRVGGQLQVFPPKSQRSRRTVPLPETVAGALAEHRLRQQREQETAAAWQDSGYVFVSQVGTPVDPDNFSRLFGSLCERAGVRRVRLHDLRHTCVSMLLALGEHPRVVMEIAGHSAIEMTMNVYGHVALDSQRTALRKLDNLIGEGSDEADRPDESGDAEGPEG
jgi:integrase